MKWQPIETAPENTYILTYAELDERPVGISIFTSQDVVTQELQSSSSNKNGRRLVFQESIKKVRDWSGGDHCEPTHWQPLPEPPK